MPNRVRTKKPIRFRNRGDSPLAPAAPGKRELLLKLAQEFQQMMIESMEGVGVSRKEQMLTYRRASRGGRTQGTSEYAADGQNFCHCGSAQQLAA